MQKMVHICIIIVIVVAIAFTALMLILHYDENGETNMPFDISKISIISTTDAQDVEDSKNEWNKEISQDNDIYIYINKNEDYDKKATIEKVTINNFKASKEPTRGSLAIYRPSSNKNAIFENQDEYKSTEIIFTGEQSTDIQNLQISNQGGIIAFRCCNSNIGTYVSNNEEEINHEELLKKLNINNEDLKMTISFDIEILLSNGTGFQSTITIDCPVGDIVTDGKTSTEITDLDIVFKRE